MNAAIWGFVAASVSGSANTLRMGADRLNGLDAWRRVARYTAHGKKVHAGTLRREMKVVVDRPTQSIEKLEEGISEFENAIKQYEDAGGEVYSDNAKKMDRLKFLPGDLGESLIWRAAGAGGPAAPKDHITIMMGRIFQVKEKLPLHAVAHEPHDETGMEEADECLAAVG